MATGMAGTFLGPLTEATWSMPASCTVHVVNCPTCTEGFRAQHCVSGNARDTTACWPPVASRVASPDHPFLGWGYYSPGTACPTGYTAACTAQYDARPEWPVQFNLFPGETAIGCCPEGFRCANQLGNTCIAYARTDNPIVIPTGVCSGGSLVSVVQATLPVVITTTVTETGAANGAGPTVTTETQTPDFMLAAPMFQLNYKSSDLEAASSTSASGSQLAATTPPPAASTSADPGANNLNSPAGSSPSPAAGASGQGGMATGAVAGIAVGAALGGILLAAVVGWLWWAHVRKRGQSEETAHPPPPGVGNWADGSDYRAAELATKHDMAELEGRRGVPLGWAAQASPVELSSASSDRMGHVHHYG